MKGKILISLVLLVLIIGPIYTAYNKGDLKENMQFANCTVIEFEYLGKLNYSVNYVFHVNGKKYKGMVDTSYFKCDDGTKGCFGGKFKVAYSSKNPNNNEIDLKKYNKYKTSLNSIFTE